MKTQPNEARCRSTCVTHIMKLPVCCPRSMNPVEGSQVSISYTPALLLIEVQSLHDYISEYIWGRGGVRSMEGMIQNITQDCANLIATRVTAFAELKLLPDQQMIVECEAFPK